jgi:hypothetical protein
VRLTSTSSTRIAATLSLIALALISVSDFLLTDFWDHNAMVTSVVADILVLVIGIAVVNEYLTARSRRRWRLVADYSLVELASCCRHVWVHLAEAIGIGRREELTRDELRDAVRSPREEERHLERLAHRFAQDADARRGLKELVGDLTRTSRDVLTSWAPVLVETPYSGELSRYVELQALLGGLDLVLWEEAEGKAPSYEGTGNPEWIGSRVCELIELGCQLELEFHRAAAAMEVRAPGAG